jgi:mandelate racemase
MALAKPVRAYGAVGYDGARGSAKAAEDWARRGFKGIKAKIGYPDIKEDLEVIRAIRATAGDDVAIMVDYNQCLTPADAVQRLRVLDDLGLTWIEEPTLAHDYQGHALAARVPIQSGENWWGTQDLRHAIDAYASDYVMFDVMKIGGVTGWMRAASLAEIHGIPVSSQVECGMAIPPDTVGSGVLKQGSGKNLPSPTAVQRRVIQRKHYTRENTWQ